MGQTYSSLEIILVDDGSTDRSPVLCDEWAQRDKRIRVIHKANGGLSDARNAALDVMTGELVTMIDGDDYVSHRFVEALYEAIDRHQADIAISNWQLFRSGREPDEELPAGTTQCQVYSQSEAINAVFYQDTLTNSACSRLYRSALWNDVRFPEGMLYEDLAVVYQVLKRTRCVVYEPTPLYFYRQRPSSITGTFTPERVHVLDILDDLEQTVDPCYRRAVQSRRLSAHFNILLLCPPDKEYDPVRHRCWQVIKQLRGSCLTDSHVRRKNKFGILFSYLGRNLFIRFFAKNRLR